MNTTIDLETELRRLSEHAVPAADEILRDIDARRLHRDRRHRNVAWMAAAAAVVLVGGGVTVASGVLQGDPGVLVPADGGAGRSVSEEHDPTADADPTPEDHGPAVPVTDGADTGAPDDAGSDQAVEARLVAHAPTTVTAPVTADPPDGLTGRTWKQAPGKLGVTWFDQAALQELRDEAAANPDPEARPDPRGRVAEVGYTITDDRDGELTMFGSAGLGAPSVTRQDYPVAGHDASLDTAPFGTLDGFGFSASARLSWQLSDGRWIHVWATRAEDDPAPSPLLVAFAETVREEPQVLPAGVTIGLTLPGLQRESRHQEADSPGYSDASVLLCPDDYDPLKADLGSAVTSGSTITVNADELDSADRHCVIAMLTSYSPETRAMLDPGVVIPVGGREVHVMQGAAVARVDLEDGLTATVTVPRSVGLSDQQLAELAASVQVVQD